MEPRSFSINKVVSQLPKIFDRFIAGPLTSERLSDTWQINQVRISERSLSSKSPIHRNFFINNELIPSSPHPQRSKIIKIKQDPTRIHKKRLDQLDMELDSQEMKLSNLENPKTLENLFLSYSEYLEGIIQCISLVPNNYVNLLKRANTGFVNVFKKLFPKVMHLNAEYSEKSTQSIMTINPGKSSMILTKLGDIINEELAGVEKLERYIMKNFILNKRKAKVSNSGVQTDYKVNSDGVIKYEFKSYDQIERELDSLRKINSVLMQEKAILDQNYHNLGDTEKLVYRNKVLESMVIKMRTLGNYNIEELNLNEDEDLVFNKSGSLIPSPPTKD